MNEFSKSKYMNVSCIYVNKENITLKVHILINIYEPSLPPHSAILLGLPFPSPHSQLKVQEMKASSQR